MTMTITTPKSEYQEDLLETFSLTKTTTGSELVFSKPIVVPQIFDLDPTCAVYELTATLPIAHVTPVYVPFDQINLQSGGIQNLLALSEVGTGTERWGYKNISDKTITFRISYSVTFEAKPNGFREAWITSSNGALPGGVGKRRAYSKVLATSESHIIALNGSAIIKLPPSEWFAVEVYQSSGAICNLGDTFPFVSEVSINIQ